MESKPSLLKRMIIFYAALSLSHLRCQLSPGESLGLSVLFVRCVSVLFVGIECYSREEKQITPSKRTIAVRLLSAGISNKLQTQNNVTKCPIPPLRTIRSFSAWPFCMRISFVYKGRYVWFALQIKRDMLPHGNAICKGRAFARYICCATAQQTRYVASRQRDALPSGASPRPTDLGYSLVRWVVALISPICPITPQFFQHPRLFQKTLTKSEKWGKITVAYKVSNKEKNK